MLVIYITNTVTHLVSSESFKHFGHGALPRKQTTHEAALINSHPRGIQTNISHATLIVCFYLLYLWSGGTGTSWGTLEGGTNMILISTLKRIDIKLSHKSTRTFGPGRPLLPCQPEIPLGPWKDDDYVNGQWKAQCVENSDTYCWGSRMQATAPCPLPVSACLE